MKQLSKITFQLLAGANCATIILMFLVGNADMINPVSFPTVE